MVLSMLRSPKLTFIFYGFPANISNSISSLPCVLYAPQILHITLYFLIQLYKFKTNKMHCLQRDTPTCP